MTESTSPYQKFAEMMLHKDSRWIPAILKSMITDEQAELLMSLPGTAEDMAGRTGRSTEAIEKDLQDMFRKGLTFKKIKDGVTTWKPPAHLAQFHDATIVWPEAGEDFYELWRKYMEEEWPQLAQLITDLLPRPFTRVIPVDKSVDVGKARVLAPENVNDIITSAKKLAVTKCTCRTTMKQCDGPIDVCIQVDRGADYSIDRGSGREVSRQEALEIVEQARRAGLIHVTMNKSGIGHFVCNCCGCCCQAFTLLISQGLALCDPSRFRPLIDMDLCTGCGECEDRCWFGAINVSEDGAGVAADKCLGCGQCATVCPEEAITMEEVREPGFIPV
jgi:Pyruvate/2-oxoacid:ferredoxin oxidoreductase delta subunit